MLQALDRSDDLAVELDLVKSALRVTFDDDDTHIEQLIRSQAARYLDFTGRALVARRYSYRVADLCDRMLLPVSPVQSITSVAYLDSADQSQTVDAGNYSLIELMGQPALALSPDWSVPTISDQALPVTIELLAGPVAAPDAGTPGHLVADPIDQQNIMLLVARIYDTGEAMSDRDMRLSMGQRRLFR